MLSATYSVAANVKIS